mmetsp:Transcript_17949/g.42754  ORF Transcript_17949/g.42754 Transcript_17949/m.42754 type:complete len:375 (+) Transcript_17949:192-1316(+)
MSHLGNMHVHGIAVKPDNETALDYFRRGADLGNAAAQNGLGYMHMYGRGVEQSFDRAHAYFTKASDQGNSEGRFNLAALHIAGSGVKKDYGKALYHFTIAANQGHMMALYNLAMMNLNGLGTPRSCTTALQFLKGVSERGVWGRQLQHGYRYFVSGESSLAVLSYVQAAELGFETAQSNLATLFDRHGDDEMMTPKGTTAAAASLHWYTRAAEQNNVEAYLRLGDLHFYGVGTPISFTKAASNYRKAGDARNAQALFNLGFMHHQGMGIPKDWHLAKRYYDMASETSKEAALPVMLALWGLSAEQSFLSLVNNADDRLLAWTTRLGVRPVSIRAAAPWLAAYWDGLVIALLLGTLGVVFMIQQHRQRQGQRQGA